MKRTTSLLLFISLFLMPNGTIAQPAQTNYSADEVIIQFTEDVTEAEITAFLTLYNLNLIDGPTEILEFYLAQIDPDLGFPGWIDYSNFIDPVNGVIITAETAGEVKSIGLKYFDTSNPLIGFKPAIVGIGHSPLMYCNNLNYSINIPNLSDLEIDAAIFDTGANPQLLAGPYFSQETPGINFVENTNFPIDDHGHGSHITSIMINAIAQAAPSSNSLGLPINLSAFKTNDILGLGTLWDLIQGIDKVIKDEVKVANLSLGYDANYDHRNNEYAPLKVAISAAETMTGTLFIVAAGNDGINIDTPGELSHYPAAFTNDNIITVTAIDCVESLPRWANFGETSVDIAAPGVNILGLNEENEYQLESGTSHATALATGVSLQLTTHLEKFDYAEIKCILINSANQSSFLEGLVNSGGYLHAEDAFDVLNTSTCAVVEPGGLPTLSNFNSGSMPNEINLNGTTLTIPSSKTQTATITIFNTLGQVLSTQKVSLYKGNTELDLNWPTQINPNMYLINVRYGQTSKTLKSIR